MNKDEGERYMLKERLECRDWVLWGGKIFKVIFFKKLLRGRKNVRVKG